MQWSVIESFLLQSGLWGEFCLISSLFLLGFILVALPKLAQGLGFWCCLLALAVDFYFCGLTPDEGVFAGFRFGPHLVFLKRFLIVSASIALFSYTEWTQGRKIAHRTDVYFLLIISLFGLQILVQAESLWLIFFAAEVFTVCSFALSKPLGSGIDQQKAVLTYFGSGALASALGLFGLSWVMGFDSLTGPGMAEIFTSPAIFPAIGSFFFLSFLIFKMGGFPFHFWMPKIFEETPTPWVGFISVAPKVAGAFAFVHIIQQLPVDLSVPLCFLVAIGSTLGNLAALKSGTLKNMFAFSAIAQAAFLMVPAIISPRVPHSEFQLLIFAVGYGIVNQGLFCGLQYFENHIQDGLSLVHLSGQIRVHPVPSIAILILILSIVGIPPTIGFTGKLLVFSTLIPGSGSLETNVGIFLFGLLFIQTLLSMGYYFQIPYQLIFKQNPVEFSLLRPSAATLFWTLITSGFAVLAFIKPGFFFSLP